MRVDVSNLAAANFNFPSITSSQSLFTENPTGSPAESQSRSTREQKKKKKISSRKSRKTKCSRKRESPLVHSSRKSRQKLSAVAVGERREEEKKEE
jgi:hypothetical protein